MGLPLSCGPLFPVAPHSGSHSQAEVSPGGPATQEADSLLNGVAGDGAAPGVAGWGPGQDEAVSVHIQASDIQRGAWGPWLLGCCI